MDLRYLRRRKAEAVRRMSAELEHRSALDIREADEVILRPLGQIPAPFPVTHGEYLVDDNDYLMEMLPQTSPSTAPMQLEGRTLYGGWLRKTWGHFLMGGLGRMWVTTIEGFMQGIDHVLFFSEEFSELQGNYLELMALLGVADKMIIANTPVAVKQLVIPEISFEHDRFNSPECRETFEHIQRRALSTKESEPSSPKKVFLTRSKLKNAKLDEVNLERIERLFADNGYSVIAPERIRLTELICILDEADEIASVGGSTAHNFVFAPQGHQKRFSIIERHATPNTFQVNIDDMMGINVAYVDAFFMPSFSSSQDRPVLFGRTPYLMAFIASMNWNGDALADKGSTRERKRELRRYLTRHRRYFGHSESLQAWEVDCAPVLAEAVLETADYYSPWLVELRPLLWFDYLSPRFYLRIIKRRLLRK